MMNYDTFCDNLSSKLVFYCMANKDETVKLMTIDAVVLKKVSLAKNAHHNWDSSSKNA